MSRKINKQGKEEEENPLPQQESEEEPEQTSQTLSGPPLGTHEEPCGDKECFANLNEFWQARNVVMRVMKEGEKMKSPPPPSNNVSRDKDEKK